MPFAIISQIRGVISDFAVIIAIVTMSCADLFMNLRTPKLIGIFSVSIIKNVFNPLFL